MNFTQDEIEAMKETAEALEWWAEVGYQYTTTNCEADKMSLDDMYFSICSGGETSKNLICRYQISLIRALRKFEIFYESMLSDNETMAKYVKEKYDRVRKYTEDNDRPGRPERQAPWIARDYARDLAGTLRNIVRKSRDGSTDNQAGEKTKTRTKLGRPKVKGEEVQKRRDLKAKWERYRNTVKGPNRKKNFCDDNDITPEYLENSILRWCRDHPKKSKKTQ